MPVTYKIYKDLGLVHVRYSGFGLLDESFEAIERYLRDPGYRPGQKQLVDMSELTGYERDYTRLFEMQALKADAFLPGPETLLVYYTPTGPSKEVGRLIMRSWEDVGTSVVPVILEDEAEVLSVLGLDVASLDELTKRAV